MSRYNPFCNQKPTLRKRGPVRLSNQLGRLGIKPTQMTSPAQVTEGCLHWCARNIGKECNCRTGRPIAGVGL